MKLKRTLKMERNTIVTLLIISIGALGAGVIIEFVLQALLSAECYAGLHLDFITNVMLGVAGSATISLLCLIFPYLEKKKRQEAKVQKLVRKVYCDYARMLTTICSNFAREEEDNSYFGEYQLRRDAQLLSESAEQLSDQYGQMEISNDGIDQIVAETDSIIALTEIVNVFLSSEIPQNTDSESSEYEIFGKKEDFDVEENQELYLFLLQTMEDIISQDSMKKLFENYISNTEALVMNLKSSTKDLLSAIRNKRKSDKIAQARIKIALEMMKTRKKIYQKRNEPRIQVLTRTQALSKKVEELPKEVEEKYCREINEIYKMMDYKGCISALERTKHLEEEISQIPIN